MNSGWVKANVVCARLLYSVGATSLSADSDSQSMELQRLEGLLSELQSVDSSLSAVLPVDSLPLNNSITGYVFKWSESHHYDAVLL